VTIRDVDLLLGRRNGGVATAAAICRNIVRLDLSNKGLSELPNEALEELRHLRFLELAHNRLSDLGTRVGFAGVLEELNISYNKFVDLPVWIGQLKRLRVLNVEHNILGDDFDGLPREGQYMRRLVASDTGMTDFPAAAVLRFKDLVWLDVSNSVQTSHNSSFLELNVIASVPPQLANLVWLTLLDLRNLELVDLPESLGGLKRLTQLYLGGNLLASLPRFVLRLVRLEVLDLSGNHITYLPLRMGPELGATLKQLYLANNRLHLLPDDIGEMKALRLLDLSGNRWVKEELVKLVGIAAKTKVTGLSDAYTKALKRGDSTFFLSNCCRGGGSGETSNHHHHHRQQQQHQSSNCFYHTSTKEGGKAAPAAQQQPLVQWSSLDVDWDAINPTSVEKLVAFGHLDSQLTSSDQEATSDDEETSFELPNRFGLKDPKPVPTYDFMNLHLVELNLGPHSFTPSDIHAKKAMGRQEHFEAMVEIDRKLRERCSGKIPGRKAKGIYFTTVEGQFSDAEEDEEEVHVVS